MNDQTVEAGANPVPRYSTLMIAIHWSTAIAVVVAYMLSEGGPTIRQDPPLLHFAFGLSVLALTVARIAARAVQPVPPPSLAMAPPTARLSRVVHATLYILLIVVPLVGWLVASRMRLPVRIFAMAVPALNVPTPRFMDAVWAGIHQVGGNLLLGLAALHALAAVWHHCVRKHKLINRMNPF
jgi:cytochrome b561